jgi:multidrug efflux pump subunit AcrA (membrane-fusion protein)
VYLKARNAKFEAGNRQQIFAWMQSTICRQAYYENKLKKAEEGLMRAEEERLAIYEKSSQEYMLELEDQERNAAEEVIEMQKEESYAEALKDAKFLETLGKQKEGLLLQASDQVRRAQEALHEMRSTAGSTAELDDQIAANEELIALGAHKEVQEVLVANLPESLKNHGTCGLIRAPDTKCNQLWVEPLQPFPEKFDDLGTMRRYIYSTNKIYREKHPTVKKKTAAELDEQFGDTFNKPVKAEADDSNAADASAETPTAPVDEVHDPVPAHFATGVSVQTNIDPTSLSQEEKARLVQEMAKIVGCDPSALNVR